mgnify:CR=1 FL=1
MTSITINFSERDTAPERLDQLARYHGITREQLVKRFIADGLGGYGLRQVSHDETFTDLEGMLVLSGALKPIDE